MALKASGNLRDYLKKNEISKSLQLTWCQEMVHTLAYIHQCRVIVADIRCPEYFLGEHLSIRKSSILPETVNMRTFDADGCSILTDMG
jgi:serine/threonine protein kinase